MNKERISKKATVDDEDNDYEDGQPSTEVLDSTAPLESIEEGDWTSADAVLEDRRCR